MKTMKQQETLKRERHFQERPNLKKEKSMQEKSRIRGEFQRERLGYLLESGV